VLLQGRGPGWWTGPLAGAVGHSFAAPVGARHGALRQARGGGINQI